MTACQFTLACTALLRILLTVHPCSLHCAPCSPPPQAVTDGVLKVMSKMGISTIASYKGSQVRPGVLLRVPCLRAASLCATNMRVLPGGMRKRWRCPPVLTCCPPGPLASPARSLRPWAWAPTSSVPASLVSPGHTALALLLDVPPVRHLSSPERAAFRLCCHAFSTAQLNSSPSHPPTHPPAGTASRIGGVSFEQLAADQLKLHAQVGRQTLSSSHALHVNPALGLPVPAG